MSNQAGKCYSPSHQLLSQCYRLCVCAAAATSDFISVGSSELNSVALHIIYTFVNSAFLKGSMVNPTATKTHILTLNKRKMTKLGAPENVPLIMAYLDWIEVGHKPCETLRQLLMQPKDPLTNALLSAIVYRVGNKGCRANYVGETRKILQSRIRDHHGAVRRRETTVTIGVGSLFQYFTTRIE